MGTRANPSIAAVVATQVFADVFRESGVRMGKFVVVFDAEAAVDLERIGSIDVTGPNGYRFAVDPHQRFTAANANGWLPPSSGNGSPWYMAFDRRGFLTEGEYAITVRFADGESRTRSRTLHEATPMLDAYLERRARIARTPAGSVALTDDAVELSWTTLRELGGPSAWYCTRVAQGHSWPLIDSAAIVHEDDVFAGGVERGLDCRSTRFRPPAGVNDFTWFTEILDSNRLEEINLAIFQPAIQITVMR
jgi:hypothetical protein